MNPFEDETTPGPWKEETTTVTTPAVVPPSEGKVVVTLKGGAGYDAPWIVVHANDAADALEQLNDKKLGELIARTKVVAGHFSGGGQQVKQNPAQPGKPAGATQAPGGETRTCKHGEMKFDTKVSKKTGKPYSAFFCQGPQEDSCGIVFPDKRN